MRGGVELLVQISVYGEKADLSIDEPERPLMTQRQHVITPRSSKWLRVSEQSTPFNLRQNGKSLARSFRSRTLQFKGRTQSVLEKQLYPLNQFAGGFSEPLGKALAIAFTDCPFGCQFALSHDAGEVFGKIRAL